MIWITKNVRKLLFSRIFRVLGENPDNEKRNEIDNQ